MRYFKKFLVLLLVLVFSFNMNIFASDFDIVEDDDRGLFSNDETNKDGKLLPPDFRPNNNYSLSQGSIDYISGMMDTFAISEYERFFNKKFTNIVIADTGNK